MTESIEPCTKAPNCPHGKDHKPPCSTPLAGLSDVDIANLRWLLGGQGKPGQAGVE